MHLQNLLAVSASVFAATASAEFGHPHIGGDGTHFHVTDLFVSANPNDNRPMVGFNVSAVHPNNTMRGFPVTECQLDLDWGTNSTNLQDLKKFYPCDDPKLQFYFGTNVRFNGYQESTNGWMLELKHHFGNSSEFDRFWKAFNEQKVKTNGTGADQYQWLDIIPDFWHIAHVGWPLRMS